jgi:hypothetical protein
VPPSGRYLRCFVAFLLRLLSGKVSNIGLVHGDYNVAIPPTTSFARANSAAKLPQKNIGTRTKMLKHVDSSGGSGLSQKEYCNEQGISYSVH